MGTWRSLWGVTDRLLAKPSFPSGTPALSAMRRRGLKAGRLSGTFEATLGRSEGLDYYFKAPDRTPA